MRKLLIRFKRYIIEKINLVINKIFEFFLGIFNIKSYLSRVNGVNYNDV